jgi:hypothetical protein
LPGAVVVNALVITRAPLSATTISSGSGWFDYAPQKTPAIDGATVRCARSTLALGTFALNCLHEDMKAAVDRRSREMSSIAVTIDRVELQSR